MPSAANTKRNYTQGIRVYLVLTITFLMFAGYYAFGRYLKFSSVQNALVQGQETLITLQRNEVKTAKEYSDLKKTFDQQFSTVLKMLDSVYPSQENYTNLARLFDEFFQENNTVVNPIFVSDLKFGIARIDSSKDYAVLPVTLTIPSTRNNFLKFLKFIENSGVLEDETRLMDVSSISINFGSSPEEISSSSETLLNVSVALNAYFQKPVATKKTS